MKKALFLAMGLLGSNSSFAADISYTNLGLDMLSIEYGTPVNIAGYKVDRVAGANMEGSWGFHENAFVRFSSYSARAESEDGVLEVRQSESSIGIGGAFKPAESLSAFVYFGVLGGKAEVCSSSYRSPHFTSIFASV